MIQNADELRICQRRLLELRTCAEQIVTHPQKGRRVKEMELAGVHGMIEQLQREIQSYELTRIQHSIHTLRDELQGIEAAKTSVRDSENAGCAGGSDPCPAACFGFVA